MISSLGRLLDYQVRLLIQNLWIIFYKDIKIKNSKRLSIAELKNKKINTNKASLEAIKGGGMPGCHEMEA